MLERVHLVHKLLDRYHVFTSPEIRGLHVTADTEADAQRAAIEVVHAIAEEVGMPAPVVEFTSMAEAT